MLQIIHQRLTGYLFQLVCACKFLRDEQTPLWGVTPIRTWLPLTPNTVTVTLSPTINVSPTLRVKMGMVFSISYALPVVSHCKFLYKL